MLDPGLSCRLGPCCGQCWRCAFRAADPEGNHHASQLLEIAMKFASIVLALLLASCTAYDHIAMTKSGNFERDRIFKLGGTISQRGADGSSMASDDQVSFRDFTVAATTIAGSVASAAVAKSREVTSRAADANAANLAVQKSKDAAAVETAKINANAAATSDAIKAGSVPAVSPITPPPPP